MKRLAAVLRRVADRIDRQGAPKAMSYSFTFERNRGIVFNSEHRGCRLWYLGDADYERAHSEALNPAPRVNWEALDTSRRRAAGFLLWR